MSEKSKIGKIWYLKKINLMMGLEKDQIEFVASNCLMKEYKKKEILYSPLDDKESIYFLKKGMVRLYRIDPTGKEITFALLNQGESFGALTPSGEGQENREFAQALEPTLVCFVPREMFFSMTSKTPYLNRQVTKLLGLRLVEVQMLLEELAFKSVLQRIASLLLRLHKKFGKPHGDGHIIAQSLSHYDLSTMIGATREATTVALDRLKKLDLIEVRRKKIILKDLEQLEELKENF